MAEGFNYRHLSNLNISPKVEVETELLSLESCDSKENYNFVAENVRVKREEKDLFLTITISDSDDDCEDASRIYGGGTIPSSKDIKTEQPIVLVDLCDESEYQEEELGNNYNDDPVDIMIDLDSGPAPVPIRRSTRNLSSAHVPIRPSTRNSSSAHVPFRRTTRNLSAAHVSIRPSTRNLSSASVPIRRSIRILSSAHVPIRPSNRNLSSAREPIRRLTRHEIFLCYKFKCDRAYTRKASLDKHTKSHPELDRTFEEKVGSRFRCKICNADFKYKRTLSKHIQRSHLSNASTSAFRNMTWLPCENCDEAFPLAKLLGKHQRKVHSIGMLPRYKCEPCDMLFWTHKSFSSHIRTTKHKLRKREERIAVLKNEKIEIKAGK